MSPPACRHSSKGASLAGERRPDSNPTYCGHTARPHQAAPSALAIAEAGMSFTLCRHCAKRVACTISFNLTSGP